MRCPVESTYLPDEVRLHTTSFCALGLAYYAVLSWYLLTEPLPRGVFGTSEPADGSRRGGGGFGAGRRTSLAGSGLPRLTTSLRGMPRLFPAR